MVAAQVRRRDGSRCQASLGRCECCVADKGGGGWLPSPGSAWLAGLLLCVVGRGDVLVPVVVKDGLFTNKLCHHPAYGGVVYVEALAS